MENNVPISVLIADDHEIYRDGLRMMLKKQTGIEWFGEAENGRDVIEMARKLKPDIILMDIVMPLKSGIAATKYLKENYPGISVIALSMYNEDNLVVDMLEAGAKGFLLKNSDKKEIIDAINTVYKQTPFYCKSTTGKLAQMIGNSSFNPFLKTQKNIFSEKEIEIIKYVCQELTNKQIGEKLFISSRTVEGVRLRIQEKINAKSSTGIVIYAIKNGLFKPI